MIVALCLSQLLFAFLPTFAGGISCQRPKSHLSQENPSSSFPNLQTLAKTARLALQVPEEWFRLRLAPRLALHAVTRTAGAEGS